MLRLLSGVSDETFIIPVTFSCHPERRFASIRRFDNAEARRISFLVFRSTGDSTRSFAPPERRICDWLYCGAQDDIPRMPFRAGGVSHGESRLRGAAGGVQLGIARTRREPLGSDEPHASLRWARLGVVSVIHRACLSWGVG